MSIKIGVTGVGGGVGQSIVKSLYDTGYEIVGMDGEPLGTGLYSVPTAHIIPYARTADFIPALLDICRKEEIKLLFPGMDAELLPLSENADRFKAIGTTVVVSNRSVVKISDDKLETYEQLTSFGVKVPFTKVLTEYDFSSGNLKYPFIIKQRVDGARSKNVFLVKNQIELKEVLSATASTTGNYIVQEYIDGAEYTCGSVNLDGECKGVIVMRRQLRDGDTYKCFTEENIEIENTVRTIMANIKPFGACNVQLRLRDGVPYVFEINARCSGTTASRTLCGFNEPKMIADFLLKGIEPAYHIKPLTVLRYWKELVVDNEQVAAMAECRSGRNSSHPRL